MLCRYRGDFFRVGRKLFRYPLLGYTFRIDIAWNLSSKASPSLFLFTFLSCYFFTFLSYSSSHRVQKI